MMRLPSKVETFTDGMEVVALLIIFALHLPIGHCKYAIIKEFQTHVFDPSAVVISYEVINKTLLNLNMTILKIQNAKVLCTFRIKRQVGGKMKSVLNWKQVDYCKFLAIYKNDKVLRLIFSKLFQSTYVNSCPMKKGFYYLRNAHFDADLMGLVLQRGMYYAQLDASMMRDGIVRLISGQWKFLLP